MPLHIIEDFLKSVVINNCVDANQAGNMANRRSHSRIINLEIMHPSFGSKRQNTVES